MHTFCFEKSISAWITFLNLKYFDIEIKSNTWRTLPLIHSLLAVFLDVASGSCERQDSRFINITQLFQNYKTIISYDTTPALLSFWSNIYSHSILYYLISYRSTPYKNLPCSNVNSSYMHTAEHRYLQYHG